MTQQKTIQKQETKAKPVFSKRLGSVQVAIWANERVGTNGEPFKVLNLTTGNDYPDGKGGYVAKRSYTAFETQLLQVLLCAAQEWMEEHR